MAVTVKKGGKSSILALSESVKSKLGNSYATTGDDMKYGDLPRLPTGIFDLDYAIGGGLPRGKISTFYGKESSMKTATALKAMAQAQIEDPKGQYKQAIIDLELTHDDPEWLAKAVPHPERVHVFRVNTAEEGVDLLEAILQADDVNYVLVDSLAMMATNNELESSAEKASVGGTSALIGKMFRKATVCLTKAADEGRYPVVVFINQLRFKIGVMFGNPESQPGGMAPKHMSAMTLKFYAKEERGLTDKQGLPEGEVMAWRKVSVQVEKKKAFAMSKACDFKFCVIPTVDGYQPFDTPYWARLENHLKDAGLLEKDGNAYRFNGEATFGTLKELRDACLEDPDLERHVKTTLYNARKKSVLGADAILTKTTLPKGYGDA